MRGEISEPAQAVLRTLVDAYNHQPEGRFTLARSISRRGTLRISHPECNVSVFPNIINELIDARLVAISSDEPGYQIVEITLRGFDYDAHMEQPTV